MKTKLFFNLFIFIVLLTPSLAAAQTNEFTYQGRLTDNGIAANGSYDMRFALYNGAEVPTAIQVISRNAVQVTNGVFSVVLDFPASFFSGTDRWIGVAIRPAGSADPFTALLPRQKITSSPYAIKSLNAENATNAGNATNADNALQLGGINANQFVQTN
ncbi:MAG TPA: hypothetical protein VK308_10490, partial [Pyrinomonadaceae bacterium]|nr:hypothetical protein [Pyrinomonadaceae bacterium]